MYRLKTYSGLTVYGDWLWVNKWAKDNKFDARYIEKSTDDGKTWIIVSYLI